MPFSTRSFLWFSDARRDMMPRHGCCGAIPVTIPAALSLASEFAKRQFKMKK